MTTKKIIEDMKKEEISIKISNILCEMPCGDTSNAETCAKYQNWAYEEIEKLLSNQKQEFLKILDELKMEKAEKIELMKVIGSWTIDRGFETSIEMEHFLAEDMIKKFNQKIETIKKRFK